MSTVAIVVVSALWIAAVLTVWCWCVAAARADEMIERATRSPRLPATPMEPLSTWERRQLTMASLTDFNCTAAWLNEAGQLRIGPKAVAQIKRRLVCHYTTGRSGGMPEQDVHIYGRSLAECADVAARLESLREIA